MASTNLDNEQPKGRFVAHNLARPHHWESLGQLRAVSFLRIGYVGVVVVPVFAFFLVVWNSHVEKQLFFRLPSALFWSFLGSTFLAIGHLLNEILCPKLIKIHGTIEHYHRYLGEFVKNENAISRAGEVALRLKMVQQLRTETAPLQESVQLDLLIERTAAALSQVVQESSQTLTADEVPIDNYREEWHSANSRLSAVRWTIVFCYLLAASIALWLTARQLFNVFLAAFPDFFVRPVL